MIVPDRMYRSKCIEEKGGRCQFCGDATDIQVHHIDGDRTNNEIDNLIPLCQECHFDVHNGTNEEWNAKLLPPDDRRHVIAQRHIYERKRRESQVTSSSPSGSSSKKRSGTIMTIPDPELVKRRTVDSGGRVYVGREYEGQEFRVILERMENE